MDVLILGCSDIVRRRVVAALLGLDEVRTIHLASRRDLESAVALGAKSGRFFRSYEAALRECAGMLCYVSLPNELHHEWAAAALEHGLHVVVDKPATTSLAKTQELAMKAATAGLCCAEANVWDYHPRTVAVRRFLESEELHPTRLAALFSFPPFRASNFRMSPQLGGGSLFDVGPYVASSARIFFGELPLEVTCRINSRASGVDTSFSMLGVFSGERAIVAHCGFTTEYKNHLTVLGPEFWLEFERPFTSPPDWTEAISGRLRGEVTRVEGTAGDAFALFLRDVVDSIARKSTKHFESRMLMDAQFLETMRRSARSSESA